MPSLESLGKNWDVIGGTLGIMIKECPRLSFHTQKHWFTGCSIKNAPPKSIKIRALFVFYYIFLAKIWPRNPFPSKFWLIKNLFSSVLTKTCGKTLKMPKFPYYWGCILYGTPCMSSFSFENAQATKLWFWNWCHWQVFDLAHYR